MYSETHMQPTSKPASNSMGNPHSVSDHCRCHSRARSGLQPPAGKNLRHIESPVFAQFLVQTGPQLSQVG